MHEEQRERAQALLKTKGIEQALFADPASVTWLTGFAPGIQVGESPFVGGPALVWYAGGEFTLLVMDGQATEARQTGLPVATYVGNTIDQPLRGPERMAAALLDLTRSAGQVRRNLGVEEQHLPAFLAEQIRHELPENTGWQAIDRWLAPLRQVKTGEELEKLRQAFDLTGFGFAAARQAVRPGVREMDVWSALQTAIVRNAGQRVPLGNDCVVGYRKENIGGWPLDLELRPGDSLIVDLGARWEGYWSDGCATYFVGEPSARQRAIHQTVRQALELGISLIKPGAICGEIDRWLREFIRQAGYPVYPHHSGHGVGVMSHEEPRIVPYNKLPLEPGMVVMLEPGIYFPGETGVRLEDALLVTAAGAELLTHHEKGLP